MIRWQYIALLAFTMLRTPAWALTFTCQEGVSGPANCGNLDAGMNSFSPDLNYGTNVNLLVGTVIGTTNLYRTIEEFNLDSINGATISACTLTVVVNTISSPTAGTINRMVRADWDEATMTWNSYKSGSMWTVSGAASTATDITTTAAVAYTAPTGTGTFVFPSLTTLCQDALDSRSGRLIFRIAQDATGVGVNYYFADSSDGATAANRPLLTVTYTGGGGGLGNRMRKLLGVGRRGPWWPDDYEPPFPVGPFIH